MNKNNFIQLYKLIESSKKIISNEAYMGILHFYEHDEYEMAFEGLLIELVKENKHPRDFNKTKWKTLGLDFGLEKDSVFDCDIWNKFIIWMNQYNEN